MQKYWLKRGTSDTLTVVALGWSADENMVADFDFGPTDVLCVYDYRQIDELVAETLGYQHKVLIAWSFGVWTSERFGVDFDVSIAVAGLPQPIDPTFGIPPRAFAMTVRGVRNSGIDTFNERMTSGFKFTPSHRDVEGQVAELEVLGTESVRLPKTEFRWDHAVICLGDNIFPVSPMRDYWTSVGVQISEIESPHYPFTSAEFQKLYLQLVRQ